MKPAVCILKLSTGYAVLMGKDGRGVIGWQSLEQAIKEHEANLRGVPQVNAVLWTGVTNASYVETDSDISNIRPLLTGQIVTERNFIAHLTYAPLKPEAEALWNSGTKPNTEVIFDV